MVAEGQKTFIGAHGEAPIGFNYHSEMHFAKMGGLDNFEVRIFHEGFIETNNF